MSQIRPHQQMLHWAKEKPNEIFLRQIIDRQFHDFTYAQVVDQAQRIVSALNDMGIERNDKVALLSKNCAEWFIIDLAFMLGGFVSVPIFPTAGFATISHVLNHSGSKAIFIGKLDKNDEAMKALDVFQNVPAIALPYPSIPQEICQHTWQDLLKFPPADATAASTSYNDDDLMSIVYTSGTSGRPKGAMLTHGAFTWSVQQLIDYLTIKGEERLFSYLPLAHITERVYIMGTAMMGGLCTAFPESVDSFIDDVKMQRPTLFISIPRLWALFQQRIQNKLPQKKLDLLLKIPFVSSMIKKKIAQNLGLDQARVLGCGSAPVAPDLLRWFEKMGMQITEAWGMTETFAYGTLNYPFRPDKVGTTGHAAPGVNIKLGTADEVLIKSQGLLSGYYKDPKASEKAFDDGWFCTGDIGHFDKDGFLTIKGRINDTFKTAKGKFVNPVHIEKKLFALNSMTENICVIGSGMPAPIMVVILSKNPDLTTGDYETELSEVLKKLNAGLESHERVKGIYIAKEPWSVENGMITPTLKVKRNLIEQRYEQVGLNWPKGTYVQWES